ncbi:hypothetical protein FXB41_03945 [Bradyrhizobium canariense]|nr:hypothetical protein [Bradyrhizobium canariense]
MSAFPLKIDALSEAPTGPSSRQIRGI